MGGPLAHLIFHTPSTYPSIPDTPAPHSDHAGFLEYPGVTTVCQWHLNQQRSTLLLTCGHAWKSPGRTTEHLECCTAQKIALQFGLCDPDSSNSWKRVSVPLAHTSGSSTVHFLFLEGTVSLNSLVSRESPDQEWASLGRACAAREAELQSLPPSRSHHHRDFNKTLEHELRLNAIAL